MPYMQQTRSLVGGWQRNRRKPPILVSFCLVACLLLHITGCDSDDPPTVKGLVAPGGLHYKGVMGSSETDKPLLFGIEDTDDNLLSDRTIYFELLEGDGTLSADSLDTGETGLAVLTYTFSGDLGHAAIRAVAPGLDTLEVTLRADILIPGENGQGQYILVDDLYRDITAFNGPPNSLDVFSGISQIVVANYEATLGAVFIIYDTDRNGSIEPNSPVHAVIVVDSVFPQPPDFVDKSARYQGTTVEGIGMGASYWQDIVPVYGEADRIIFQDDENVPGWEVIYDSLYLVFWCHPADTTVFQIDISEEFDWSLFDEPTASPADFADRLRHLTKPGRR